LEEEKEFSDTVKGLVFTVEGLGEWMRKESSLIWARVQGFVFRV